MHEFATVTIWFSLYIAGMILTMLIPSAFPEPSRTEKIQDDRIPVPSYEGTEGQKTSANRVCCGQSHEGLEFQACCPSSG